MTSVVARDVTATDHMVYPWPFRITDQVELVCDDNDCAVIAVGWSVAEQVGPGRHTWTPLNPALPINAYFVRTSALPVKFDMTTACILPSNHQVVRMRALGSLLVRVKEPSLLVHQFVGLPFDDVNEGLVRSVQQSVERLIARALVRRCIVHSTPLAVTDPTMLPAIIDELVGRNPCGGAVQGIEFVRFNQLSIMLDDMPPQPTPSSWEQQSSGDWGMSGAGVTAPMPMPQQGHGQPTPTTIPPPPAEPVLLPIGSRVLVYWSDGLWHSAAVVQVSPQGQYQIELGDRSERVWVEWNQVVPE